MRSFKDVMEKSDLNTDFDSIRISLASPEKIESGRFFYRPMKLAEMDATGRRKPVPSGEDAVEMPADRVIMATGQSVIEDLMPEKAAPDTSKFLLCPMPGLVVKISVEVGQEVQEGQALATVEAMKMENILRAERRGVVKRIAARAGASLKVDDVIMEFE